MTVTITAPRTDEAVHADRRPGTRLGRLLDPGTVVPLHPADDSGVSAARGRINGFPVVAYCTDASRMGGALGAAGAQHIIDAIRLALWKHWPVVGLWHSGGAKLADGVESMDGVGRMFAMMTKASGRIPQISVVLGPAAGAAAYGPALTDLVIMSDAARVFVTGPNVVQSVTGEQVDMESLGGPAVHAQRSGVAHATTTSEAEAFARARRITELLARPGHVDLGLVADRRDLRALLPASSRRAYDVRPLVRHLLDEDGDAPPFEELQPGWARNMVIGLGRLAGRTVGVLANNPLRKGGCLDSQSAEKAARFVRMCDALGVPLVVLVDVPGYLPGVGQEWEGVVRRGAKLLHAFAEAEVPRVTLITRKSYGGAYIAMNSRSLGATAVFAWPEAEVAVMGAEAAVGVLHRRELAAAPPEQVDELRARLLEEHRRESGGVGRALALGVIDEVIDPADTRRRLAEALTAARHRRGRHGNIPL
ncbi:acyl-CoA carboxylase subunit beta [Micromonospora eburnea]|uniref:Acetyl-CoA/propionyl-CoA carboxylase carboxyl transferase subunit n=1 Tax=Micromonospora eburnea TaxID=227316 RepID=A0A1C6UHP2_9ACTN|nr:carboxyl transferase domain-containing protein [Micromonospora eburnea]SCL53464.1 acetyl-CoA/propionyl-CoA carboxylase carboxyl transferase subunit [Micromonospora eburnea]